MHPRIHNFLFAHILGRAGHEQVMGIEWHEFDTLLTTIALVGV